MWQLPDQKTGFYDIKLQLPDGIKCEQCILQVKQLILRILEYLGGLRSKIHVIRELITFLFHSGPTTLQIVGVGMKMEKNVLVVDHKKRLGHVQI